MSQKHNTDKQTSPQELAQPQEYLHKWFTRLEILLTLTGVWGSVGSCRFFQMITHSSNRGRERDTCWADRQQTLWNLLSPSAPSSPARRNQAGPGLRRTALVIDKTSWKKRTAHLRRYRRSACELDFWEVSRLKRPLTSGAKRYANWIFQVIIHGIILPTFWLSWMVLYCWCVFFSCRCCLEMTLNLID